jgi:hypothetical protein
MTIAVPHPLKLLLRQLNRMQPETLTDQATRAFRAFSSALTTVAGVIARFLKLPYIEDSPTWEFINGEASQKSIPGGKHSRLQPRLAGAINAIGLRYKVGK